MISFEELTTISDQNFGRYNRNVNHETILKVIPEIKGWNMLIKPIMEHEHFNGQPTETHLRCIIEHGISLLTSDKDIHQRFNHPWFQDISFEQWEWLREPSEDNKYVNNKN